MAQEVITEKLVQYQNDRLLPFSVPAFVIRYAYPTPQGQMRTGEQVVTRRFFEQLGGPGTPVPVTMREDNPAVSAVPRLTFPGNSGWRMGIALAAIFAASALGSGGVKLLREKARLAQYSQRTDSNF